MVSRTMPAADTMGITSGTGIDPHRPVWGNRGDLIRPTRGIS